MKFRLQNPFTLMFAVITVISLACSVDLYGTPAPAPQPPAQSEPTTAVVDPAVETSPTLPPEQTFTNAQQFFTEEFDGNMDAWKYLVVNGSKSQVIDGIVGLMSVRPIGGLLIFDLQGPGAWIYATYEPFNYSSVRLDVRVNNRGSNNNNVSLICRKSDAGWFEFDIASNGLYEILYGQILPDNTAAYTPIADGGSNKIKPGLQENEYGIVCQDNTLILYINGTETRRLEDKKYLLPEGKVGISVSSFRDVPVIVDFYWAKISQP
ncbi:MAG: hypothetical protein HY863_19310 [Chloroflexi bacterium]|nr:hypothetical protein [Chloroflexota bacterium]